MTSDHLERGANFFAGSSIDDAIAAKAINVPSDVARRLIGALPSVLSLTRLRGLTGGGMCAASPKPARDLVTSITEGRDRSDVGSNHISSTGDTSSRPSRTSNFQSVARTSSPSPPQRFFLASTTAAHARQSDLVPDRRPTPSASRRRATARLRACVTHRRTGPVGQADRNWTTSSSGALAAPQGR